MEAAQFGRMSSNRVITNMGDLIVRLLETLKGLNIG